MRHFLAIGILCLAVCIVRAQNITYAEYFIDTDPGHGDATGISITPGTSINQSFNIPMGALSNGLHRIGYRVAQASGPSYIWSLTHTASVYKITVATPNIVEMEYFVDSDPGFGNGQSISITQGSTINTSFLVDLSALARGVHILNIRGKDNNGVWSSTHAVPFYVVTAVASNLTKLEYFFGSDPGFGNGTQVAITPAPTINQAYLIDMSSRPKGLQILHTRTKDAIGQWSLTHSIPVVNVSTSIPNITRVEYFFDNNAPTNVPITPGTTVNHSFVANCSGLSAGIHIFHMRALDASGNWSLVGRQPVVIMKTASNIVAVEYAIDTDPGIGNGTRINITPTADMNEDVLIPLDAVALGNHTVYIRLLDSNGAWSTTEKTTFEVCEVGVPIPVTRDVWTNRFRISWDPIPDAVSYRLDVSTDNFATFVTGFNNKIVSDTTVLVTGLASGQSYQYRVRARAVCTSANSATQTVETYMKTLTTDSTALVQLYNSTNGANWTTRSNWLSLPVVTWSGVTVVSERVQNLELAANNLVGQIPAEVANLSGLVSMNVSDNEIDALPDLHLIPALTTLNVSNNKLSFEDLEANAPINTFTYSPQADLGQGDTLVFTEGDLMDIEVTVAGSANLYQWRLNGANVNGETSTSVSRTVTLADNGLWRLAITNTIVPGLELQTVPVKVIVQQQGIIADSLALVALYNSTGGENWINNTNWLTGNVSTWYGVTVTGDDVTAIDLHDNNLQGVPDDSLALLFELTSINLSGNNLTSLPNLTALPALAVLDVSNNNLDFASLEQNIGLIDFDYTNQEIIGDPDTVVVAVKTSYDLTVTLQGESNLYQWKKDGVSIAGADSSTFHIQEINRSNIGTYACEITNEVVEGLTMISPAITIFVSADISGVLYATETEVATKGQVTLFRITATNGYDTIAVQDIDNQGFYQFEDVLLDEYQLLGFADKTDYPFLLPTYFQQSLYWEEADTLFVDSVLTNVNVMLQREPVEQPNGIGLLSGVVFEEIADVGGRVKANKRVKGAGVSARKVERGGRGKEDLVLTLTAYGFTNEDGEFEFPDLPAAEYRLNVQYPGYPMDESTSIDINIGSGIDQQKRVEATVQDGKIKVRELLITGVNDGFYPVDLYPNPTSASTTVKFARASTERRIIVRDLMGRAIQTREANARTCNLNLQQVARGLYFLDIEEHTTLVRTLRLDVR